MTLKDILAKVSGLDTIIIPEEVRPVEQKEEVKLSEQQKEEVRPVEQKEEVRPVEQQSELQKRIKELEEQNRKLSGKVLSDDSTKSIEEYIFDICRPNHEKRSFKL